MGLFDNAVTYVQHQREVPNQVRGGYKLPDGSWTNDRSAIKKDFKDLRAEGRQMAKNRKRK